MHAQLLYAEAKTENEISLSPAYSTQAGWALTKTGNLLAQLATAVYLTKH
jgi:hypothetical protein